MAVNCAQVRKKKNVVDISGQLIAESVMLRSNQNNFTCFLPCRGTSGIDIDLRRVDIDQCPLPPGSTQLNIFAASDKCKKRTTQVRNLLARSWETQVCVKRYVTQKAHWKLKGLYSFSMHLPLATSASPNACRFRKLSCGYQCQHSLDRMALNKPVP